MTSDETSTEGHSPSRAPAEQVYVGAIDDFGTGRGISKGWTMLALPIEAAAVLELVVKAELGKTPFNAFHGKDFARRFRSEYVAVLSALKTALAGSADSFAVCTLLERKWDTTFRTFTTNVVKNALTKSGVDPTVLGEQLVHLTLPLWTFQRFSESRLPEDGMLHLMLDEDNILRELANATIQAAGKTVPALCLARPLWRASRDQNFPRSPRLARRGVTIGTDESAPLVQVADLLGNFSAAYTASALGRASKTLAEKRSIFDEVFGDTIGTPDFSSVQLVGDGDFALKDSGAFTLIIALPRPALARVSVEDVRT